MRHPLRSLVAITTIGVLLGGAAACRNRITPEPFDAGRMGATRLFPPDGDRKALVFLFSDRDGWNAAYDEAAAAISRNGAVVVGVDLPTYLARLAASDDGCHYLISEVEDFSQKLQRRFAFAGYRSPLLAGVGAGGTLAYAALTQAPAATVAGAVSIDPSDVLPTKVPLCPGAPSTSSTNGFAYGAATGTMHGEWQVDTASRSAALQALIDATQARTSTAEGTAPQRIASIVGATIQRAHDGVEPSDLADLPLVEIPSEHSGGLLAIIFSGDGGWRDIDKQIGEILAQRGAPVVGVDCLRYFWQRKTPDEVARDLARVVRVYSQRWKAPKTVLIGYSFGAAILPFAVNRLPDDVRTSVVQVSLLGLEPRASFEIRVAGWLGAVPGKENPEVLPELMRMGTTGLQCVYGEEEEETLCTRPEIEGAEVIQTTGGHHFDGDYVSLARRILNGAKRRAGARPLSAAGRRAAP